MNRSKKSLGQHFLSDPRILGRIADALPDKPVPVLEIGPGRGGLTRALLGRGRRVIAIEKDASLAEALEPNVSCSEGRLSLLRADALEVDWHTAVGGEPFQVCGNIPYNVTSPLIEKALAPPRPLHIVFLIQAEVADRLVAGAGSKTYGALSVGVQAVSRVERLFMVKSGAFTPRPKVESAVVRLTPLAEPLVAREEEAAFRRAVQGCFSLRRKQLRSVIRRLTQRSSREVESIIERAGLDPMMRPETVSVSDFVALLRHAELL